MARHSALFTVISYSTAPIGNERLIKAPLVLSPTPGVSSCRDGKAWLFAGCWSAAQWAKIKGMHVEFYHAFMNCQCILNLKCCSLYCILVGLSTHTQKKMLLCSLLTSKLWLKKLPFLTHTKIQIFFSIRMLFAQSPVVSPTSCLANMDNLFFVGKLFILSPLFFF